MRINKIRSNDQKKTKKKRKKRGRMSPKTKYTVGWISFEASNMAKYRRWIECETQAADDYFFQRRIQLNSE